MSVIFKPRSTFRRIAPLWVMAALCVYCCVCVVLFTWLSGGRNVQAVYPGNGFNQVQLLKFYNQLELLSKVSPANILGRIKHIEADSPDSEGGNSSCSDALDTFADALGSGKIWALQMVDASSKVPDGLLGGNLVDLGAYDECVDITEGDTGAPFTGQHCLVVLHLGFASLPGFAPPGVIAVLGGSVAYTFALCLPSSCSPATLALALADVAGDINDLTSSANLTVTFTVDATDCHVKQRPPLDTTELLGIIVTLCSVVLVAISTIIDLTLIHQNDSALQEPRGCLRALTAFSMYTNGRRLVDTRVPEDTLGVLHALKVLGIAWVTLGHRIKFSAQAPLTNLLKLADYIENWSSMIVLNATLSVDVFFLISGILNTYGYMKLARHRGKSLMSHLVGYVHRYLRLTPAYALMILVTATWLYRLGDGPLWDRLVGDARQDCAQYWWSGLLYINNYYNPNNNCMMQSWYLAADMQLFWLSPLVLYPLWRWPVAGVVNLITLVVVSIIVPFAVAYFDQIKTPIPISFDQEKVNREMAELYFPTHTKAVSYLIGILTGYYLHWLRFNKLNLNINWLTNLTLWTLAVISIAYGLFGGYYIFQLDSPYNRLQSSFYIGVYRFFWSIGLAWVVLACTVGYGGFVNSWLTVKVFAPLGRLTYCIYLSHVAVIMYSIGSMREPQHFTYYEMVMKFLGEFVIATFLAIVLSLTIEAPIMVLEKIFLGDNRGSRRHLHGSSPKNSSRSRYPNGESPHQA